MIETSTPAHTRTPAQLVDAYYAAWTNGSARFDPGTLRAILAQDLIFDGPLAGHRVGADGFLKALESIAASVRSFTVVHRLEQDNRVAVMYDCDLTRPAGVTRFAEFFTVDNDRIQSIDLQYDGTEWRKLAG
jgi:hypothetical protein